MVQPHAVQISGSGQIPGIGPSAPWPQPFAGKRTPLQPVSLAPGGIREDSLCPRPCLLFSLLSIFQKKQQRPPQRVRLRVCPPARFTGCHPQCRCFVNTCSPQTGCCKSVYAKFCSACVLMQSRWTCLGATLDQAVPTAL